MYQLGWFSTGRDKATGDLLEAAWNSIQRGEIKAESKLGKGTTIKFYVPLKTEYAPCGDDVAEANAQIARAAGHPKRADGEVTLVGKNLDDDWSLELQAILVAQHLFRSRE